MSNQSPVFNKIIKFFEAYSNSQPIKRGSQYKVDTYDEYVLLGQFINGKDNITSTPNGIEFNRLSTDEKQMLYDIYEKLGANFTGKKITKETNDTKELVEKLYLMNCQTPEQINPEYNKQQYNKIINQVTKDNILDIPCELIATNYARTPAELKKDFLKIEKFLVQKLNSLLDNPTYKRALHNINELHNKNEVEYIKYFDELENKHGYTTCNEIRKMLSRTIVNPIKIGETYKYKEEQLEKNGAYLKHLQVTIGELEEIIGRQEEIDRINSLNKHPENDTRSELQKAAEKLFVENFGFSMLTNDFSDADGIIETSAAVQKEDVCWALAAINSLAAKENGRLLLKETCYSDRQHGISAIKIMEASLQQKGKNNDGIYTYYDSDFYTEDYGIAGDSDVKAYMKAINEYFTEINEKKELQENKNHTTISGNTLCRFYELLTGEKAQNIENNDNLSKGIYEQNLFNYDEKIQDIVWNSTHIDFNNAKKFIMNDGFMTVAITFSSNGKIIENEDLKEMTETKNVSNIRGMHAFSIVGVSDEGKLILQESNNSEEIAKLFSDAKQDNNGNWNIYLDKDEFEKYITSAAYFSL